MRIPTAATPLLLLLLLLPPAPAAAAESASSTVETQPVASTGDAADDPAVWVHPYDPARSLVIGNSKGGTLESYDLSGALVQRISPSSFVGNVDVRGNYVVVSSAGIKVYLVDPVTRQMSPATDGVIRTYGEGLCLYDPGAVGVTDGLYAFTVTRKVGRVRQYALTDADDDGLLAGAMVRDFTLGTEAEACVVDDTTGALFVAEEDVAVWRYSAEPGATTDRIEVARAGADMPADLEGLTIAGDYLYLSVQNVAAPNQNWVNVYDRAAPHQHVRSVRVVAGGTSDDCDRTDGIAAAAGDFGPAFSEGVFVCQDGNNGPPGLTGNQNFKFVPLDRVAP